MEDCSANCSAYIICDVFNFGSDQDQPDSRGQAGYSGPGFLKPLELFNEKWPSLVGGAMGFLPTFPNTDGPDKKSTCTLFELVEGKSQADPGYSIGTECGYIVGRKGDPKRTVPITTEVTEPAIAKLPQIPTNNNSSSNRNQNELP